ncbi:hypothetical protein QE152_g25073 [Popillia japonica]|uniref:Retroviral polymerase SH3-like domain-containing protein n=1 Tax=Popillia japonica TaxID=7064 RepID=A0AAW1K2R2_POPJA
MNINIENAKDEFCDGGALGKMHKLPLKQRTNRPTVTRELIHADVNGPMTTESFGGARKSSDQNKAPFELTAAYLLNRTGKSSDQNKAPFELWYGRSVGRFDNLRIFGTGSYLHVNKSFRSKFDDKAILGHLVGYINDKDGFRVWVPAQRKLIMSHDVRFKPETVCNLRNDSVDIEFPTEMILSQNEPSVLYEAEEENIQEAGYHDEGNPSKHETEEFITASVSGGSRDCDNSDEEDQAELPTQQTSGYPKENRKSKRPRRIP